MTNEELAKRLERDWDVLSASPDPKMEPAMRLLGQHVENPRSYVAMVGETSSGKSTLINSFLGRKFLIAGARPTTGTVTWVEHGICRRERLLAINRNATIEEVSKEQFDALSEHPDENLLRLKAEVPSCRPGFDGLTVFDTPGFNAIISEHAEVLKEFLPESDVIVFPVSYKVGFGACDRQLMKLIAEQCDRFGEVPVVLVVNRAPKEVSESDKRVAEIRLNAEDTLHRKVRVVIVNSSLPDASGVSTLPDSDCLWTEVKKIAFSEERAKALNVRLCESFASLCRQRVRELEGEVASAESGKDALKELESDREEFRRKERESYRVVDKYMARIEGELPRLLSMHAKELIARADSEIESSDRWVDASQCSAYVFGHVLPFGTTEVVRQIENYLREVFAQMDEELSEMANLAIHHINDRAQTVDNPQIGNLLANLGLRIGERIAGNLASSTIRSFGGVGGMASGAGNLAKMGVKNIGKIFGKTFGREVYTNIGKIFTKRMVQTMTVCLQVAVELALFVWEASRWQGQLKEKVVECVDKWQSEVAAEFGGTMIGEYRSSNYENVRACYEGLLLEVETSIENASRDYERAEVDKLTSKICHLKEVIGEVGAEHGKI